MKNIGIFLGFIAYATFIFFIQQPAFLGGILAINIFVMLLLHAPIYMTIRRTFKILPFILFTVILNWFLTGYEYAIIIGIKLLLVCHITYVYATTTTTKEVAVTIKKLCTPLKLLKVNLEEIELLVCISLSMMPILKKQFLELKDAAIAKGMDMTVRNMKIILTKLMISILRRVNELEESVLEKGYGEM